MDTKSFAFLDLLISWESQFVLKLEKIECVADWALLLPIATLGMKECQMTWVRLRYLFEVVDVKKCEFIDVLRH